VTGDEQRSAPAPPADEPTPKVTPYLLRRADDCCPRRLDLEHRGGSGNDDPVNRGRVRAAFLDAARTAHTLDVRLPPPPWRVAAGLTPEEEVVFEQAVHWYCRLFGDREVELFDHDLDRPTDLDGVHLRLGGWVDLTVVGTDGRRELRQLDFWGRAAPADLLDEWSVRLALLRLAEAHQDWLGDGPATVSWTDLLHGVRREVEVDTPDALDAARGALDERVDTLVARAATGEVAHGADCPSCKFHKGCPEFPKAMRVGRMLRRNELLPGVLPITPSSIEAWNRCRRLWRDQHVLQIPPSDDATPGVHGQQVHDLLRLLHQGGPCDDPARIDDVVAAHGASARVHAELTDHARRCPLGAASYGHEITRVRLHSRAPSFVASARIDAAWIHDGLLDVRDYKTGGAWHERVADDPRARLQAWVMAPVAEELGLQLRLRYEHLAAEIVDDPEEWEPDADDLAEIGDTLARAVHAMRAEAEWHGVADRDVCRTCRYRSICPDSAAPGAAAWPRVDDDPDSPEYEPA
jgi:hypothetical protein